MGTRRDHHWGMKRVFKPVGRRWIRALDPVDLQQISSRGGFNVCNSRQTGIQSQEPRAGWQRPSQASVYRAVTSDSCSEFLIWPHSANSSCIRLRPTFALKAPGAFRPSVQKVQIERPGGFLFPPLNRGDALWPVQYINIHSKEQYRRAANADYRSWPQQKTCATHNFLQL